MAGPVADLVVRNARVHTLDPAVPRAGVEEHGDAEWVEGEGLDYPALQDLSGGEPFVPGQAVDLVTAIGAYTVGGAYGNFCEDDRGTLAPGKAADLIAVSDDLFQIPPGQIKDCRVELTMVAGQIHHQLW